MDPPHALIERAQKGDLAAHNALIVHYQDMAVAYAYGLLGDFQRAEDAAQEAFLVAYTELPSLRNVGAFPAWLRRLVATRCERIRRGRSVRTELLDEGREATAAPGPDAWTECRERDAWLRAGMQRLPPEQREVLTLHYMNELSYTELAGFLDVPVSTVRFRLHDARRRLRKELMQMAKKELRRNRPSRDDAFATQTLDTLVQLTPYQLTRLLISTDQQQLVALMQSAEALRERILNHVTPHVRAVLESELRRSSCGPDEARAAQEQALKTAAGIPPAPPKPGKKLRAAQQQLATELESHTLAEIEPPALAQAFATMAETARAEGVQALSRFQGAQDRFITTGLDLLLHGSSPEVIGEVLEPMLHAALEHQRVRYGMITTTVRELAVERHPALTTIQLGALCRPPRDLGVDASDGTITKLRCRVKATPASALTTDALAELLAATAWLAHKSGLTRLADNADMFDGPLLQAGMRWLVQGLDGNRLFRPAPATMAEMVATRADGLLRDQELRYRMVLDGLASLQAGTHPELMRHKLRNHYEWPE